MSYPAIVSIVDDDLDVRSATASLVRSVGAEARTFASAQEFLESADLHATACLITDVQMPGMTGLELLERVQALHCTFPVIVVTAYETESAQRRAMSSGARAFMSKPIDADELLDCLESCCG